MQFSAFLLLITFVLVIIINKEASFYLHTRIIHGSPLQDQGTQQRAALLFWKIMFL
jgi:hypothetical protein